MDTTRDEEIRKRAFALWRDAGQPDGQDAEHWYQAERELAAAAVDGPVEAEPDDDPREGDDGRSDPLAPRDDNDALMTLTQPPPDAAEDTPDSLPPRDPRRSLDVPD